MHQCVEKSKGVLKPHDSKMDPVEYPPVLLLKRAYLRAEIWVQHLWGTALALAFIESEVNRVGLLIVGSEFGSVKDSEEPRS